MKAYRKGPEIGRFSSSASHGNRHFLRLSVALPEIPTYVSEYELYNSKTLT